MDIRRRIIGNISSGELSPGTYAVNLNGQWEKTTAISNPDSTLYDGVYQSASNYNVNNGYATMYITINGFTTFKLYIRSYAESNYDYVMVSQLDTTITGTTAYSDTTLVKAHTRGNQQSSTTISNYTEVKFENIDEGEHTITILYRKDGSTHSGDDRGYLLISKQQEDGEDNDDTGGSEDVDTTYAIYYTSTDGNIVSPASGCISPGVANNVYTNGQGIMTFNSPVLRIESGAFRGATTLKTITFPDSITYYSARIFQDCSSLTSVNIGNGMTSLASYTFYNCPKLQSVTLSQNLTHIDDCAFFECSSLRTMTLPSSVETITESPFRNCPGLQTFSGKFASSDQRCLIVGTKLHAFATYNLITYTIPDGITDIADHAFGYSTLTTVSIPNTVTTLGVESFGYSKLTSVTIPGSIEIVDKSSFYCCDQLKTVTLQEGVTTVTGNAFDSCKITTLNLPTTITTIGNSAFRNCSHTHVYIQNMTKFFQITVAGRNSWPTIWYLYLLGERVTELTFNTSIQEINDYLFWTCDFDSIHFNDNISHIGSYAFDSSYAVDIYCPAVTPPTLGTNVFGSGAVLYVPNESLETYLTADGWSDYSAQIQGYDF